MRTYILAGAASICLFMAMTSCNSSKHATAKKLPGIWQLEPIAVDGSNRDWPSPYPEYDDKAMLGYSVSNDKDNLYVTVETGDPATQLKILREGLTLWIDKTGGEEQVTAINYPLPNHRKVTTAETEDRTGAGQWQQGHGGSADKQRLALEDKIRLLLNEAREYSLQGFKGCNLQFPLTENDTCGIIVRMAIDMDNEMVWEAVIPFKSFYYKREIEKRDNGKAMSVCFETIGEKRPPGQGNSGGNRGGGIRPSIGFGGMGGMGMGMRMGGGRGMQNGGNGGQGNPNIMEPLYKSTSTWKKFGLAHP